MFWLLNYDTHRQNSIYENMPFFSTFYTIFNWSSIQRCDSERLYTTTWRQCIVQSLMQKRFLCRGIHCWNRSRPFHKNRLSSMQRFFLVVKTEKNLLCTCPITDFIFTKGWFTISSLSCKCKHRRMWIYLRRDIIGPTIRVFRQKFCGPITLKIAFLDMAH